MSLNELKIENEHKHLFSLKQIKYLDLDKETLCFGYFYILKGVKKFS